MNYDRYLVCICIIFALLIICMRNMAKINNDRPLSVKTNKLVTGDWTDRDIIFYQDAVVSGVFMVGSINRDVVISLSKDIRLTGVNSESIVRFVIAPGRKITIQKKNNDSNKLNIIFDKIKVSWPDLTHGGRQLILKNVHIIGTESAEISAPNIESVSLVLQEDQKKFIPVSK